MPSLSKYTRWAACFDPHGDCADKPTVEAFRTFCTFWKPTIRVHGGDAFDFRWLRRSASDEEKLESVEADFAAGMDFLKWYRPTHILWGNHDQRLYDALDSTSGALRQLAGEWIDRIAVQCGSAQTFPYDKRRGVMRLGNYSVVHGYCHGIGATRKHALTYGNVLHGHVHRNDIATVEGLEPRRAYSVGCLCQLDFQYNRANIGTLAQQHGWAYGLLSPKGTLIVWIAQQVEGSWVLPSELRQIAG